MNRYADDADRSAVVEGLRRALADSGMSQAEFARALGTSASRLSTYLSGHTIPGATFYVRALRIGRALREAAGQGWMTPRATTEAIRAELAGHDEVWALRMALQGRDHLRELLDGGLGAVAAWQARPGTTGSQAWDRLFAAVVAHEFETRGQPAPTWTLTESTSEPWILPNPFFTAEQIREQTPSWLARRGVFITERDLTTA